MTSPNRRTHAQRVTALVLAMALFATALATMSAVVASPAAAQANLETDVILRKYIPGSNGIPSEAGEVRSSQDGTDYGSSPRLMNFDDSSWPVTAMVPQPDATAGRVGFYAPHGDVPADDRGYYFRYEVDIEDVYQITDMDLEIYYDDAAVVFINGQEVYRTLRGNIPGLETTNPSIYQSVISGGRENYYVPIPGDFTCEDRNPCPPATLPAIDPTNLVSSPVADSPNALVEGTNVVMAMVWTTPNSDLGLDVAMSVTRDLDAPFPAPIVSDVSNQANELADNVNLLVDAITENNQGSLSFSATGLPPGLTINPSSGRITGAPTSIGTFNVNVVVADNVGTTPVSFSWTIENAAPVITDPGPQQTPVDNAVSLSLSVTDPDGGSPTVTVSGLPPGLNFSSANNTISGSPSTEGPFVVTVSAQDNENESVSIQIPWQIAEPPIDLPNPGPQSTLWGQSVNLPINASDPAGGTVVLAADPLPSGLTINQATGSITGTPTAVGTTNVVLQGTGPSGSALISFEWEIRNRVPSVTVPGNQRTLAQFTESTLTASASDPDGGAVTLSASGMPQGIDFDPATGVFSGTAEIGGTYTVTVTGTDDEGAPRNASFQWEVLPAVDHPIQINEVVVSNDGSLLDEEGKSPDWFEIVNTSGIAIDITGWTIADSSVAWTVPQVILDPGEYLVIFASDKDRTDPAGTLHTNFKLSKEGDALSIATPGVGQLIDQVDPLPVGFADVSIGVRPNGSFGYLATPTPGAANSGAGSDYAPILRPFTDRLYNRGDSINEQIDAFDPDGGDLSYQASLPPGATIDAATGAITGAALTSGTFPTTIEVEDAQGDKEDQPVNWFVIPPPTKPPGLILNEYNAVPSSLLFSGDPDPAFADPTGNGGDWFEFVVVEDGLDLRGWTLELWDRDNGDDLLGRSAALEFADDPALANLPAGLIITVSEDLPDDVSFNPSAGDWHINLQSSAEETDDPNGGDPIKEVFGDYFTEESQENFNSSRSNQNVIIRDATGSNRSPVVGETEAWDFSVGGVGRGEVMSLCINPTPAQIDPLADYFDNALTSSFGAPNQCGLLNDRLDPNDDTIFDQDFSALRATATLQFVTVSSDCQGGAGVLRVEVTNLDGQFVSVWVDVDGVAVRALNVPGNASATESFSGRADGPYDVEVRLGATLIAQTSENVFCGGEVNIVVTCLSGNGVITVNVSNPTAQLVTYSAVLDGFLRSSNVAGFASDMLRITGRSDGAYPIDVKRNGTVVESETVFVDCDPDVPAPSNVLPTVTCLAGNGRIDVNVLNGSSASTYELTVGALTPRTRLVAAGDWWRSPVTGRPDGPIRVMLKRNGTVIMDEDLTVACDTTPPQVTGAEVELLNICRAGRGFVAWQFANPTGAPKSYLVEFESVNNRSTTAAAFGASVRGVSGRPNGDYEARIVSGGVEVWAETVTVDC